VTQPPLEPLPPLPMPAHVVIKAPAYTGVGFRKDSKKREAPEKGAVVKKRRGEKSIIDVTGSE